MPKTTPFLTVRTRETTPGSGEGFEQAVEILDGETVIGQLPVSRVIYEMLPQNLGKISIELIVKRADIGTIDV